MATTPLTLVGHSADSPALFLRLSPATDHAAEILDVEDPCLGYDAEKFPYRGSRRSQGKIFGKGDSDEIIVGRQARFHLKKQDVLLYVTSYAERHVTVRGHKTGRVTPIYRSL